MENNYLFNKVLYTTVYYSTKAIPIYYVSLDKI